MHDCHAAVRFAFLTTNRYVLRAQTLGHSDLALCLNLSIHINV